MSLQDLSLPVDVPWKLIATSPDMLATHDSKFPNAMWKNSLAVFAFNPDLSDLTDEFTDREITFLKVVCSITSYTPACLPMPAQPNMADYGEDLSTYADDLQKWKQQVKAIDDVEKQTYPCCGALVQVAVYPKEGDTDINDVSKLAYFASFEPKKRELIEVVTESGESMTQSKSDLTVRKGVTATDSTENLDVFTGANVNVGYAGAQVGVGVSGQWGTIKKASTERVDTTNTDTSRESRETASHTTSLSQLYHLLNSYHAGTNRAIFFIQPRPHTAQQKDRFTFIHGPQEIEGIQEFFLVLVRPKGTDLEKDYCVDALLYTAHLDPDETSAAVLAPKELESLWFELWKATKKPPKQTGWSWGWLGLLFGIPPEAVAVTEGVVNAFASQTDNQATQLFNQDPSGAPQDEVAVAIAPVSILDQSFPAPMGFKIDRTRGLGGYDLWEDPDNTSATPLGYKSDSSSPAKPQAFIEILGQGDPNDPATYRADSVLHVRAFIWPSDDLSHSTTMYHGRIKAYFIRDDSASDTKIPMFVTARGVSSCGGSPFAGFYADEADPSKLPPDIAGEDTLNPPHIAPWRISPTPPTPSPGGSGPSPSSGGSGGVITPPPPIHSSTPSGFDHVAIGSARAKMSNAIADQVRSKLKKNLACGGFKMSRFRSSDLFYQKVAKQMIAGETRQLATVVPQERGLASFVASHAAFPTVAGTVAKAFVGLRVPVPPPTAQVRPPAASARFPVITLGGKALPAAERQALLGAGIHSGIDLLGVPAATLALRLGVDESQARQIRLRAIGLGS